MNAYLPDIAWRTVVSDVTVVTPDYHYIVKVSPVDYNEPGASTADMSVGDWLLDFLGYPYEITNVSGSIITVYDINEKKWGSSFIGPTGEKPGYIYRSKNDGFLLTQAQLRHLDPSAKDIIQPIEKGVIWSYRGIKIEGKDDTETDINSENVTSLKFNTNEFIVDSGGTSWQGGNSLEVSFKNPLEELFEKKYDSINDAYYIEAKLDLFGLRDIRAYSSADAEVESIWENAPNATTYQRGFVQIGNGINVTNGIISIDTGEVSPAEHSHGNITNEGKIGSIANLPLITTTQGLIQTGSFGTTTNTFCEGNDSRLSDTREPDAHSFLSSSYHTVSELTTGQILRATSSTSFDFETLVPSDIGAATDNHTHATLSTGNGLTGSNYDGSTAREWKLDAGLYQQLLDLAAMFELENDGITDYIQAKLDLFGARDIRAYSSADAEVSSIWDTLPTASDSIKGGVKIGAGLTMTGEVLSVTGGGGGGHWEESGSNIYYNDGDVGIGTASPSYKLDVVGDVNISSGNNYKINGVNLSASDVGAAAASHNHNASNINAGTLSGDRGVLASSASSSFVRFTGGSNTASAFNNSGTNPSGTQRLNYSGYLYATRLYDGGTRVSVSGHEHSADNITSGTLPVGRGGTGATTFTAGRILFGNTTSAISTNANLFWDNTNNRLGIGITIPRYKLDLNDGGTTDNSSINLGTRTSSGIGGGVLWKSNHSGYTKISAAIRQVAEGTYFRSGIAFYTGNNANGSTNAVERMRIDMDGNVGIGTTTPSYPLVVHSVGTTADDRARIVINSHSDNANDLYFGSNGQVNRWSISGRASSQNHDLIIYRNNSGWSDVMAFDYTTGNVGIGTTAPNEKLEVNGNLRINTSAGNREFVIENSGSSSTLIRNNGFLILQGGTSSGIAFNYNGGTEGFRLNNDGNVGIGTTPNSNSLLHMVKASGNSILSVERTTTGTACVQLAAYSEANYILSRASVTSSTARKLGIMMGTTEKFAFQTNGNFEADGDIIAYAS